MAPIEMIGRRFGSLTVVALNPERTRKGARRYDCVCDCGGNVTVIGDTLRTPRHSSCGCHQRATLAARNRKHGQFNTKEWRAWQHIKGRCGNPNDAAYENYGGRGITMCLAWQDSFEAFFEHIGPAPSPEMTVERIENDKGYEPGNVCWATMLEQKSNMRRTIRTEIDGECVSLFAACRKVGADYERARRLVHKGTAPADAVAAASPSC